MDKVRALQTFISVAEQSNFSAAARKLNVSAPSVTRIIGELEAHLNVVLFTRTTRIVSLTEIGVRYYEDAQRIVEDIRIADNAARGSHQTPTGTLRVTASEVFGEKYITPIATEYLNLYPEVRVEALFVNRVVNIIEEGIDIAVRIGELPDSSLSANRIGSFTMLCCGSPDYFDKVGEPDSPDDLYKHNQVSLSLENYQSEWKFNNGFNFKPDYRLLFNSVSAAITAAKLGFGLVWVASYHVAEELEIGTLKPILTDYSPPPVPIHLLHAQGRQSSAKVRSFIDLAKAKLKTDKTLN